MTTATIPTLTTLEEALAVLDDFIEKLQQLTRVRVVCSEHYSAACNAERDERHCASRVNELEQRLKTLERQVILGSVKPGEIPALKTELETARQLLSQRQQMLGDQREALCVSESVRTDVVNDLQQIRNQLANNLPGLFAKRFGQADPNLGVRGQITWEVQDPTGATEYRRVWRARVFHDLFASVLNHSDDLAGFYALRALLTENPFRVRIVSGFFISRPGGHDVPFTEVGKDIKVPAELKFEEAFEEIRRGRVKFLVE